MFLCFDLSYIYKATMNRIQIIQKIQKRQKIQIIQGEKKELMNRLLIKYSGKIIIWEIISYRFPF